MTLKGLSDEDFVNYRKPSMFLITPSCTFKCDKENGCQLCQNMPLASAPLIKCENEDLIRRYSGNGITKAVVFGGLEPFDSFPELCEFIELFRIGHHIEDDIVIYTGYTEEEASSWIDQLRRYKNIIVKYGRFRPGCSPHYDETLGVNLASDNQYARRIA